MRALRPRHAHFHPVRRRLRRRAAAGPVLNLAWHIAGEIHGYMRKRGYRGEFIDIIAPEDFA